MYSYKKAGVNLEKADLLTQSLKKSFKSDNIGNFAGIYEHPYIPEYCFVGCTDGIGTKIIPLLKKGMLDVIAKDLVATNLNDLVCVGAKPLFFLDYIATSNLNLYVTSKLIEELKKELDVYNCSLLGGETAEMPDLIKKGNIDIAGFAVGIAKKDALLNKENVKEGDLIIGLSSNGPHSNGFTLIRKLYEENKITLEEFEEMLKPSHIYVNEILELCDKQLITAAANITGGGIAGNIPRIIPKGFCAKVDVSSIPENNSFVRLEEILGKKEAYKVFNMGVGMVVVCNIANKDEVLKGLSKFNPFIFGEVVKSENGANICFG